MTTLIERLRRRLRPAVRRLPLVDVRLGPWTRGWTLRVAHLVAMVALIAVSAGRASLVPGLTVFLLVLLVGWGLSRPGSGPGHVAVTASALLLLAGGNGPFDPAALWLAPLGYVVVRLGWWSAVTSPGERVELAALRHAGARDLAVIALTLAVGVVGLVLAGRPAGGLVLLGVAALAAVAWTAVVHGDGHDEDGRA